MLGIEASEFYRNALGQRQFQVANRLHDTLGQQVAAIVRVMRAVLKGLIEVRT